MIQFKRESAEKVLFNPLYSPILGRDLNLGDISKSLLGSFLDLFFSVKITHYQNTLPLDKPHTFVIVCLV